MKTEYIFDNAWQSERQRLDALETIWDPYTHRNIEAAGVSAGWRCLEVGAGGGSVAAWLCDRVGPEGVVVATDIDTRLLDEFDLSNLEVRQHDITRDQPERDAFDLVHARLLLEHLPGRDAALRHMFEALKPGGVLLLEEFDHVSFLPDPDAGEYALGLWDAWLRAFEALSRQRGLDLICGRRLTRLLDSLGLKDVRAECFAVVERGGVESRALLRLSIEKLRDDLVATGEIDAGQVDDLIALLRESSFSWTSQLLVAARGRRA